MEGAVIVVDENAVGDNDDDRAVDAFHQLTTSDQEPSIGLSPPKID